MNDFYVILAACPILLLGAVAFLVLVAAGVRKGDRGDLAPDPRNRLDSIARCVTGACVRRGDTDSEQRSDG
jgi:hypothetical protein